MYAEISCFVNVFYSFYIHLELFWNTIDELHFENSDVSLVDGEYNIRYTDILLTVYKMVLRISREKHKNPSPSLCVITVIIVQ